MNEEIKTRSLFTCTVPYLRELFESCEYPWELLCDIEKTIEGVLSASRGEFSEIADGVWAAEDVSIASGAALEGPAIIGAHSEIRTGAYIRGRVIVGERCVIGNSSELKNSILLGGAQVPHYNYVGDSVLGERAHLGAGAICSNLRSDGADVVIHAESDIATGMRKLGAFVGDGAEIGCGCVLAPGCVVGKNSTAYPLTFLRGAIPANSLVKSMNERVEKRI